MSARVESARINGSSFGPVVIAVIVALAVGALVGAVITKAVDDSPAAVATPAGAQLWDDQKLQAMEGRAIAERFRGTQPQIWDAQKLEAMAGRVLFLPAGVEAEVAMTAKPSSTRPGTKIEGWDAYKLEAMKGRVLAAQGAEDPPVRPHLPTNPPKG